MTLTIDLTPEQEARLAARAQAAGVADPADYLRTLIDESPTGTSDVGSTQSGTGADLLAELDAAGLLNGYGDPTVDAPELARRLRKEAETRSWD